MKKYLVYIVVFFQLINSFTGVKKIFAQTAPDSSAVISADTAATVKPPSPEGAKQSVISMSYVKEKVEHSPDSIFFNILKVTNNNGYAIQGNVKISVPVGWKIISKEETVVNINPGLSEYIPIRVSLARTATGGTSFVISATLISNRSLFTDKNQNSVSKQCYVTIPKKTKWDVIIFRFYVTFDVRLRNNRKIILSFMALDYDTS